jgi:hypothetical protein
MVTNVKCSLAATYSRETSRLFLRHRTARNKWTAKKSQNNRAGKGWLFTWVAPVLQTLSPPTINWA